MDSTRRPEVEQLAAVRRERMRAGDAERPIAIADGIPSVAGNASALASVSNRDRRSMHLPPGPFAIWSKDPADHLLLGTLSFLALAVPHGPGKFA